MFSCAYEPIHAQWPSAKCGNYEEIVVDGANDTTGWFTDWVNPDNPALNTSMPKEIGIGTLVTHANMYPRSWLVFSDKTAAKQWRTLPFPSALGRWLAQADVGLGDVDSPALYEYTPSSQFTEFQQRAWYVPPGRCLDGTTPIDCLETTHQTTQRLIRRLSESVINSHTADHPNGGRSDRLVPWLDMAMSTTAGEGGQERALEDFKVRQNIAMMRAKNIKEGIFFLSPNSGRGPNADPTLDGPTLQSIAKHQWQRTAEAVERVYTPRITAISRSLGGPNAPITDTSLLDFTLRNASGQDRVVEIQTTPISELKVQMSICRPGEDCYRSEGCWSFEINLECSVAGPSSATSNVTGVVFACDFNTNKWVAVPVLVSGEESTNSVSDRKYDKTYQFFTPESAGQRTSRRIFSLVAVNGEHFVDTYGNMLLKLVHIQNANYPVASRYDLLQVIPYSDPLGPSCGSFAPPGGGNPPTPLAVSQSDKNYDTFVDAGDLLAFLDDYAQSKLSADIDNDGDVDVDDLVLYMAYYVNES